MSAGNPFPLPMPPALPAPPQLQGAPGPFGGYNQPTQGTAPAPPNTAANLIQGINAFVQQFQNARENERKHNENMAQQSIQNMLLGLPVDVKKTAQYMKKAGMNIDFETPAPPRQAAPPVDANGVPQAGPGPLAPPPAAPQSTWDRIKQAVGMGQPQINPSSPGMQALQRLQAMGQTNLQGAEAQQQTALRSLQNEAQMQAIMKGVMSGNPTATELFARISKGGQLPTDEMFRVGKIAGISDQQVAKMLLIAQMGGNKQLEFIMDLAEKNKDRFGGNLAAAARYVNDIMTTGTSRLEPDKLTTEERIKAASVQNEIMDKHPNLPANIAHAYALASITPGGDKQASTLADFISKSFPTKGTVEQQKFDKTFGLDQRKFAEEVSQFRQSHELAVMNAVRGTLGDQFDKAMSVLMDKNADQSTKSAAAQIVVDASKKLGTLKIDGQNLNLGNAINTQRVYSWADHLNPWAQGSLQIAPQSPDAISQALGVPSYITDPEEQKFYGQKLNDHLMLMLERGNAMFPAVEAMPTR